MKLILIVIALLFIGVVYVYCEENYYRKKRKKQHKKDEANIHSKRQIEYYKGENKPKNKIEHDWIEFHLN